MIESEEGLVFLTDMNGSTLYASPALYNHTGREAGSIAGTGWHGIIHPDDRDYVTGFYADALRRRQSFAGWWRHLTRDGGYAWALVGGMPFISEISGRVIGFVGTIDPLARPDAFSRAGGIIGPDPGSQPTPHAALPRVEKIADLTLMASALAREDGETEIARALDAALMTIGFRLANLMRQSTTQPSLALPNGFGEERAPQLEIPVGDV